MNIKYHKLIFFAVLIVLNFLTFTTKAYAVCPICTIAVAGGIGLTRWLGVDDSVTGIWIGALILSSTYWTNTFLKSKNLKLNFITVFIIYFLLVYFSLYFLKLSTLKGHFLLGLDKIGFGILLGLNVFQLAKFLDLYLRKRNNGKVIIYYQKVISPIFLLTLASLLLFLYTI